MKKELQEETYLATVKLPLPFFLEMELKNMKRGPPGDGEGTPKKRQTQKMCIIPLHKRE